MFKKYYFNFILFLLIIIIGAGTSYYKIKNSINNDIRVNSIFSNMYSRNKIYNAEFSFKTNIKKYNMYLIDRNKITNLNLISQIGIKFLENKKFKDTEKKYVFEDKTTKIEIFKNMNILKYYNNISYDTNLIKEKGLLELKTSLSEDDILLIANSFLEENKVLFDYEETVINRVGSMFVINYISKLNRLKNYAFSNNIKIDENGNIKEFTYFFIDYIKYKETRLKSVKDAFYELPSNLDTKIQLKSVELVYFYKNSIVTPSYLFKGIDSNSIKKEFFVDALRIT